MNGSDQAKRLTLTITLAWIAIILLATSWNVWTEYNHDILIRVKEAARSSFKRNTALRLWLASHGGVYVPITDTTPANPHLAHIPDRDITTPSGKKLTLMNPAYAIRHFAENSKDMDSTWHLTSLNLVNPDNAPDDWETTALRTFEQGVDEVFEFATFMGTPHLRLMKPLKYNERCEKCHGHMGYKYGDIRGGVGAYFSMEKRWEEFYDRIVAIMVTYLLILFLGLGAIRFIHLQQKESAEKQRILEARLQHGEKMAAIGTMAGGIAHDFNNMLAVIIGYAELVKHDQPEHSRTREDIGEVIHAGQRAKALVQQILAFSRQTDKSVDRSLFPLSPLVKEVLKFQRSITPTTIDIKSDIEENNIHIMGNSTQIHQVVMNICTNATQAMRERGGVLEVGLHKTELSATDLTTEPGLAPGAYVRLSFNDTGPGIVPELIDCIFNPFFTTKEAGEGSGMGLSVVHGIVKDHAGFVRVESKPGEGSVFNVFLPLSDVDVVQEGTAEEPEDLPTGTERILFVDDEEALVKLGKDMLKRLGYNVTTEQSSFDAFEAFQNHPDEFDLVITDQTMPGMTGFDLAKKMLQIRSDIPIIICTGYSDLVDEEKVKNQGIKSLVFKPLTNSAIARLIRQTLDGYESAS